GKRGCEQKPEKSARVLHRRPSGSSIQGNVILPSGRTVCTLFLAAGDGADQRGAPLSAAWIGDLGQSSLSFETRRYATLLRMRPSRRALRTTLRMRSRVRNAAGPTVLPHPVRSAPSGARLEG